MTSTLTAQPRQAHAASSRQARLTQAQLLSALGPELSVRGASLLYQLGLTVVTITMMMVPLIYLALIALVGYGVWYHAIHSVAIFQHVRGKGYLLAAAVYAAPLIAGPVVVLFMFKPFFAKQVNSSLPLSLSREEQPVLFAFVDRICEVVGSPTPSRIDVDCMLNASASFRRGWRSFLSHDLVLTIGLPLVATLNLAQFTGVLAHEFGHFRQAGGMRQSYVIRRIGNWLENAVYRRDSWDQWLEACYEQSPFWAWTFVVLFVRLMVWFSRRILWVMMILSNLVSGFMSRQMEYDADRISAHVVGSDTVVSSMELLPVLGMVEDNTWDSQQSLWQDNTASDNMPLLIAQRLKNLSHDTIKSIQEHVRKHERTGLFSSHPSGKARIQYANALAEPGSFKLDVPARMVFTNFDKLSLIATAMVYQRTFGDEYAKMKLVDTREVARLEKINSDQHENMTGYTQQAFSSWDPIWPTLEASVDKPVDRDKAIAKLQQARQVILKHTAAIQAHQKQDWQDQILMLEAFMIGLGKDLKVQLGDRPTYKPASRSALRMDLNDLYNKQAQSIETLKMPWLVIETRMTLALRLLLQGETMGIADAPNLRETAMMLRTALAELRTIHPRVVKLFIQFQAMHAVINAAGSDGITETINNVIKRTAEEIYWGLMEITRELEAVELPLDHVNGPRSIAQHVMPVKPDKNDPAQILNMTPTVCFAILQVYMDIMARFINIGVDVERAAGLEPLPAPVPVQSETKED